MANKDRAARCDVAVEKRFLYFMVLDL
jgi:hypothetical protein